MARQPRIYHLLNTLNPAEQDECRQFILKRLSNAPQLYALARLILRNLNDTLSIHEIRTSLFPNLSSKEVSNKLQIIKRHLDYYLIKDIRSKNHLEELYHLYLAYRDRALYIYALKQWSKVESYCQKNKDYNTQCLFMLHKLYHSKFFSHGPDKNKNGEELITRANDYLTQFTITTQLQYLIESSIRQEDYQENSIIQMADNTGKANGYLVQVLTALRDLLEFKYKKKAYYDLIYEYLRLGQNYKTGEVYTFVLVHFIHIKIKSLLRSTQYVDWDLLNLYEFGLITQAFMQQGYISSRRFGNIINAGCAFNQPKWIEDVIDQYSSYIHPKDSYEVTQMSLGQLSLMKEDYDATIEILSNTRWTTIDHNIRYRWLMCIYYLEKKEKHVLEDFLRSFSAYLSNHSKELSQNITTGSKNFIRIIRLLARKEDRDVIISIYQSMEVLNNRSWIERKLKMLTP